MQPTPHLVRHPRHQQLDRVAHAVLLKCPQQLRRVAHGPPVDLAKGEGVMRWGDG